MLTMALRLCAVTALFVVFSTVSNATYYYPYYDVAADVGSYDPIVLGDDLELSACGSTVVNANNSSDSYSLCSFASWSLDYDFSLTWTVSFNDVTSTLATYSHSGSGSDGAASEGLEITVATGPGSLFSTVGNYVIGLWVDMDDNDYIYLPNNSWGATGNDGVWDPTDSGQLNIDFSETTLTASAISVPEPAALFLLVPGLLLIRRREKQRRAPQQA